MQIVINSCYGRFELSEKAVISYWKKKGKKVYPQKKVYYTDYFDEPEPKHFKNENDYNSWYKEHNLDDAIIPRTDIDLINVIKKLGNGPNSKLKIVEIPDDVEWEIKEYDGKEYIAEKHRTRR